MRPIIHFSLLTTTALGGTIAAALLWAASPAQALNDCAPIANGVGVPASGTTVTCSGTVNNQNGANGYGDGLQDGLTINVQSGASVTGTTNAGIAVNNNNTIDNAGTVTGFFKGISGGTGTTIINHAGALITGGSFGGVFTDNAVTVTNDGTIKGTVGGGVGVASVFGTVTVTNNSTGVIESVGNGVFSFSAHVNVTNSGRITGAAGVSAQGAGSTVTVTNYAGGMISGDTAITNSATGLITVTNYGAITGTGSEGIYAQQRDVTVTNYAGGTISGILAGIQANAGVITATNYGTISATTGPGIWGPAGVNVTNYGTISGNVGIENRFIGPVGSSTIFNAGTVTGTSGTAIAFNSGTNTLTIAPTSVINGNVFGIGADILQLGGSGTGAFNVGNIGVGQQYDGFTTFNKIGDSTWFLSGTGAQTWNVLSGTLAGNATIGGLNVASGGTFAPGNGTAGSSMTVNGNLAFQSGALYFVQLNPTTASFANVTGTSTLAGTTLSIFANGTYVSRRYTILSSAGGISGTFNSLVNTNLPSGFNATLSYDPTHAYLDLALNFTGPSFGAGLNGNQQNVANTVTNFFNTTGSIPAVFGALTPAGLTQVSGELATGTQQTTFHAMNLFMGLLTDPFIGNRGYCDDPALALYCRANHGGASAYASGDKPRSGAERDAYAAVFSKAPLVGPFAPRWGVWAAGYGGSETTNGNAVTGSNTATSRIYGAAVGADYFLSPWTIAGFALAGGGTNFSVANGGTGRSDLFQAGAFIRHTVGAAYVSGALAYGWQDITTDRAVTIAGVDRLRAQFNANAFSGRVEGGYRFVTPWMGITPYAAAQFTTFNLPAYAEQVLSGANTFALAYGPKSVTDTRSELGLRGDKSFAMPNGVLTLRGRLAWAHDYNPDRSIGATFQSLPGASFTVSGAAQAADTALTTASIERKWINGWSAAGTFEGEFSKVTASYAGKGFVRYAW